MTKKEKEFMDNFFKENFSFFKEVEPKKRKGEKTLVELMAEEIKKQKK